MGLTGSSTGKGAIDGGFVIRKKSDSDRIVALAGNPNVGKSTVFNELTGMNQHTGNWPGKTVANAYGYCRSEGGSYVFVDIPGTYSLMAHSPEEEVARNFILFGGADITVVVCDATMLERGMNLILQTLEITGNVVVCVNLMDEARRKRISLDLELLSQRLGVPVIGISAHSKRSVNELLKLLDNAEFAEVRTEPTVIYRPEIEKGIAMIEPAVKAVCGNIDSRWLSLRLLDADTSVIKEVNKELNTDIMSDEYLWETVETARNYIKSCGLGGGKLTDKIVEAIIAKAETISDGVVKYENKKYGEHDRRLDRILTGRKTGYPVMILLLMFIFWLTVTGANYPSELLSNALFSMEDKFSYWLTLINAPPVVIDLLVFGIYRVLAWVVSVMLPPMAIFFPLFTLLEDSGYLPRIAYNLDRPFYCCNACGKQSLTMCMGLGCNAAGVVGCRIIDSPRERLLAILTNSLVPCNGRFPAIISIITMFFITVGAKAASGVLTAVLLTVVILSGIAATFIITWFLSKTVLRGVPSSFTLELPPYRRPQIGKVIIRSVFDRTLFVLGRAAAVAAPAGAIIWLAANITVGGESLLLIASDFLDPAARLIGLDGVILMAFILGFPANEIVIPIVVMAYMAEGHVTEIAELSVLKQLFTDNGWTAVTGACFIAFSLFHWPCSTTLLTVKKETGSLKWTALAAVIPTALGIAVCLIIKLVSLMFAAF